jgi:hypothetical protein
MNWQLREFPAASCQKPSGVQAVEPAWQRK